MAELWCMRVFPSIISVFAMHRMVLYALAVFVATLYSCSDDAPRDLPDSSTTQECSMQKKEFADLSKYPPNPPSRQVHLLFIHHSTGGQLLADSGPEAGQNCIYAKHPNGGGLRTLLERNNYVVHEASYGSKIGNDTDICHWNAKFRDHMDTILRCRNQDELFTDDTRNRIVVFKSCFPNSWIDSEGKEPGEPDSCEHTTANYKAAYKALLPYFASRPDTLFVVFTAPPLALPPLSKAKNIVRYLLGKSDSYWAVGSRNRSFNKWLMDTEGGWLSGYPHKNVVVFNYYDVLTGHGRSDWSVYGSEGGRNSHPSSEGNALAAGEFVVFLNRAVHRMGM